MSSFRYRGRSGRGDLITGRLEAETVDAVASRLLNLGITPLQIDADSDRSTSVEELLRRLGAGRPSTVDLVLFSRQMYAITKSGLPLLRGLRGLAESTHNVVMRDALHDVLQSLESGRDLASSLARHPSIFSSLFLSMVRVGESTGTLDNAFLRLCDYLGQDQDVQDRVKAALRYPLIVADWPQMLHGAIWAPLVFLFLFRAERGERPLANALLSGFFLGVTWLAGHHQMQIFLSLAVAGTWLWIGATRRAPGARKTALLMIAAFGMTALTSAFQTLPAAEYGRQAVRWVGADQPQDLSGTVPYKVHEQYALKPISLIGIFVAGVEHGPYDAYVGVAALTFAVLGAILAWKQRQVRWLATLALCGIVFALGGNSVFHGMFYALAPLVEKARVPEAATLIFAVGLAPLAAFGLDALRRRRGCNPCPDGLGCGGIWSRGGVRGAVFFRPAGTAWPYRVTTTPETATSGHARSTTCAISAADLPAPTTTHRPRGFGGRAGGSTTRGSAAATAASNSLRRKPRASSMASPRLRGRLWSTRHARAMCRGATQEPAMDPKNLETATRTELEAAAFRRLVAHLRERTRRAEHRPDELGRLLPQLPQPLVSRGSRAAGHRPSPTPSAAKSSTACRTRSGRRSYQVEASAEKQAAFAAATVPPVAE